MNTDAIEAGGLQGGDVLIPLTQGYVAVIDSIDAHLAGHKWRVSSAGSTGVRYAIRTDSSGGKPRTEYLHRAVLGHKPGDPWVDHRDGDGLNCRRRNLRSVTVSENLQNRALPQKISTCPYIGVSWNKSDRKWQARIWQNGRRLYLGSFSTAEAANIARLSAERELWGIHPRRQEAMTVLDASPCDGDA